MTVIKLLSGFGMSLKSSLMNSVLDYYNLSLVQVPFRMKDLQIYEAQLDRDVFALKNGANLMHFLVLIRVLIVLICHLILLQTFSMKNYCLPLKKQILLELSKTTLTKSIRKFQKNNKNELSLHKKSVIYK